MAREDQHRYFAAPTVAVALTWLCCAPANAQQSPTPAARAKTTAAAAASTASKQIAGPGSLNGTWSAPDYKGSARTPPRDRVYKTIDGKWPPLLPGPAEVLEKRITQSEKGEPFTNTLMQCLPGGVPEMTFGAPFPMQIVESPGQVTFLYEMYNHFRVIHMGGTHPADPDPTFMGHSIGHWEGNTLVVDTVGLTDRTTLDEVGIPHSEDLHIIERYRRTDSNTLEIILTIDDPRTFSKPWDAKVTYKAAKPGVDLLEYICENNRSAKE